MASGTTRNLTADLANQVNDVFTISAADSNVTITNFDDLTDVGTPFHDTINLTAIFDSLGGKFTDGVNDTADRSSALQFVNGDFNGDGKVDDLRISIAGVNNFSVTLLNPADDSKDSFGIGAQNSGAYADIVVGGGPAAIVESANKATTTGQTPLYNTALQAFAINAADQLTINNVADPYTSNVQELLYQGGAIYQLAGDANSSAWYQYTPGSGYHGWTKVADPTGSQSSPGTAPTPDPNHAPSADGATTKLVGDALYNATHDAFSISADHRVAIDGTADTNTSNVLDLLYKGGSIYQHAGDPTNSAWYQYTPGSGWHDWTKVADPTAAVSSPIPPVSTPATSVVGGSTPTTPSTPTAGHLTGQFAHLDNGVNIVQGQLPKMTLTDYQYLHSIGVEHIRMAVDPYQSSGQLNPSTQWAEQLTFKQADMAIKAGLSVVLGPVSPHDIGSYEGNAGLQNQMINWFKEAATYIKDHYTPSQVYIEMPNEPFWSNANSWWNFQGKIIDAVHQIAPNFTVVATANGSNNGDWEFSDSLTAMTPYADKNVAYNFHFYDDLRFTHQGASWVPYTKDLQNFHYGQAGWGQAQNDAIMGKVATWANKYGVPVTVNEFGVIKYAPQADAAQWMNDVHDSITKYGFGWSTFEYDKSGDLMDIAHNNGAGLWTVTDSVMKALDWGPYHHADVLIA